MSEKDCFGVLFLTVFLIGLDYIPTNPFLRPPLWCAYSL